MKSIKIASILACALFSLSSCDKDDSIVDNDPGITDGVPAIYKKIYGASSITADDDWIYIKSKGVPDHKSIYFATSDSRYENFSGTTFNGRTFAKNPNMISEQNYVFKIPRNPKEASNHVATPMGPIGVSLNGVPFFNQYAGPNNQVLSGEIASFDQSWAHPAQRGDYHYHVEPILLTTSVGKSVLLGFLLDGFPVYGPEENGGTAVVESSLDQYHGHFGVTADYPNGIYHYHVTNNDPYINGSGFYGTAGTVSN